MAAANVMQQMAQDIETAGLPLPAVEVRMEATPEGTVAFSMGINPNPGVYSPIHPLSPVSPAGRPQNAPVHHPIVEPSPAPAPRAQARLDPAEKRLRKDEKWASTKRYIGLLALVNRTWGPISEVVDMINVFRNTVYRKDGEALHSWGDVYRALREHQLELDMDKFILQAFFQQMMDIAIGQLSQAEKQAMLRKFGAAHWINNAFGMPSTWASRAYKAWNAYSTP